MGNFSFYAIITIIKFRIKEYFSEYHYSIIAPLINTILFVIIFSTIDNYYALKMNDQSFIEFLIPGLILMTVVQESYDNSSVTLVNMKQIGSFDDYLTAPISRIEIFLSFLISSIIIGIFLAIVNYIVLSLFINFESIDIIYFLYYLIVAIVFFSSLGCLIGFLAYTWDTQSTISNFFVTPINLLSGTFFSINVLPDSLKFLFIYNPYYYVVNNFRSSFYNKFEFDLYVDLSIFFFVLITLIVTAYIFFKGYKVIK